MSNSPLCRVVMHNFRLDILCCLGDKAMTTTQVGARLGKATTAVSYHLKLLESLEVVERIGDDEGNDVPYRATLDKHPEWVSEAVESHRAKS